MRIIYKNLEKNRIKLGTENLNDLWHLQHLISPGDLLAAVTWRRPRSESDKVRPERREKKRTKLTIRVKEVEFQRFSKNLRVLGVIEEGTDLGEHHTINVDTDFKFVLTKDEGWEPHELERLEEARKASRRPRVLIVAMDDETATFGLVRQYGLEELGEVTSTASGKMYDSDRASSVGEYYGRVCSMISDYVNSKDVPSIIVAGPGMAKKEACSHLEDKYPGLADRVHMGATSHTGRSGLNEIIRRGIVKRVSREDRASLETELMEELMEGISKNGKAVYGLEEVLKAAEAGAVEKLLVSDEILRKERGKVEKVMERARNTGADVFVVSSGHDAGKRLFRIGGLGALLRYKIS